MTDKTIAELFMLLHRIADSLDSLVERGNSNDD